VSVSIHRCIRYLKDMHPAVTLQSNRSDARIRICP
jgi:hypothetical protein